MSFKLFRLLETVLRNYSRQPPRHLLDSRLRLRLLLRVSLSNLQSLASFVDLSQPQLSIMASGLTRKRHLTCLIIDHPLCLSLGKELLEKEEEVLVIGKGGNSSNVVGIPYGNARLPTLALAFWLHDCAFDSIKQELDAYLSVCQVFHGHLHLTFSCREAEGHLNWCEEMSTSKGDEFSDFREEGYFRILEERAARVTLEELSETFRVEKRDWGEILVSGGGKEGLVVWVTLRKFPCLGSPFNFKLSSKKIPKLVPILQSSLGFSVFKRKQFFHINLEDLDTTTVIFNFREESQGGWKEIQQKFQWLCCQFLSQGCLQLERGQLEETLCLCVRVSEQLGIAEEALVQKMLGS